MSEWHPTPEQRKHASDVLLHLWDRADEWGDMHLAKIARETLDKLGLPYVRIELIESRDPEPRGSVNAGRSD